MRRISSPLVPESRKPKNQDHPSRKKTTLSYIRKRTGTWARVKKNVFALKLNNLKKKFFYVPLLLHVHVMESQLVEGRNLLFMCSCHVCCVLYFAPVLWCVSHRSSSFKSKKEGVSSSYPRKKQSKLRGKRRAEGRFYSPCSDSRAFCYFNLAKSMGKDGKMKGSRTFGMIITRRRSFIVVFIAWFHCFLLAERKDKLFRSKISQVSFSCLIKVKSFTMHWNYIRFDNKLRH